MLRSIKRGVGGLAALALLVGPACAQYIGSSGGSGGGLSPELTSGHIFVGNSSNVATDVAASGDLTLANTGAFTVGKLQGTTVSGTTGTGNVAFSTSPTFTGTLAAAAVAIGGASIGTNALAVTGTSSFSNSILVLSGTAALPAIQIGGSSVGNLSIAGLQFTIGGNSSEILGLINNQLLLNAPAANTWQHGGPDAAVAIAQTTRVQSVVAGTAAANGANWTLIGSLPTGTGTSGDIIFQTGVKTGSGTTQGTPTTALTLKGETQNAVFAAQLVAANMTQTSSAQSGTMCWAASGLTYDATLGCLTSDERLKTDIAPLKGATQTIMALQPMTYDWSPQAPRFGADPGNHIGMGAFTAAYADERLVARGEDGQPRGWRTDAMISLTVAVAQEHERRLLALEARH